jgi:hypothetical protein
MLNPTDRDKRLRELAINKTKAAKEYEHAMIECSRKANELVKTEQELECFLKHVVMGQPVVAR